MGLLNESRTCIVSSHIIDRTYPGMASPTVKNLALCSPEEVVRSLAVTDRLHLFPPRKHPMVAGEGEFKLMVCFGNIAYRVMSDKPTDSPLADPVWCTRGRPRKHRPSSVSAGFQKSGAAEPLGRLSLQQEQNRWTKNQRLASGRAGQPPSSSRRNGRSRIARCSMPCLTAIVQLSKGTLRHSA